MKTKKLSSETIISLSAIVIAVVSILVAVWQGIETRRHNRLSVQPRLDISYSLDYTADKAQLTLKNNGLGPAIIEESTAAVGDTVYSLNNTDQFFRFLGKLGVGSIPCTFENLDLESALVPNQTQNIFALKISDLKANGISPLSLMNDVNVKVKYKSLYEEEFEVEL